MIKTQPIIAIVAALGIAVVGAQLIGIGGAGSAAAASGARWSDAFGDGKVGPALSSITVAKGDRLAAAADCATQEWPNIASACLASADGSAVRASRAVTIEYRVGDNTSVLVRAPVTQVATR